MDRFLYYLIGAAAALLFLLVAAAIYSELSDKIPIPGRAQEVADAETEATPEETPEETPQPRTGDELWVSDDLLPVSTAVSWSPQDAGVITTVTYPGFTILYSETLGAPLLVQYAMVNGAEPQIYPEPAAVKTPSLSKIQQAGFLPGEMALQNSIALYFGKQSAKNASKMTNLCAFYPPCLNGIWNQFPDLEKRWAGNFNWIEVVAGPIFQSPPATVDGLAVPTAFYRAYRRSFGDTLAFIIPQTASSEPLQTFLTSISAIESATGLKIFSNTVAGEDRRQKAKSVW